MLYSFIIFIAKIINELLGWAISPFYGGEYAVDIMGNPSFYLVLLLYTLILVYIAKKITLAGFFDKIRPVGWILLSISLFIMFGEYPNIIMWITSQTLAVLIIVVLPFLRRKKEVKKKASLVKIIKKVFAALKEGWQEEAAKK